MLLLETAAAAVAEDPDIAAAVDAFAGEIEKGLHIPRFVTSIIIAAVIIIVAKILIAIIKRMILKLSKRSRKFTFIMAQLVWKLAAALIWVIAIVSVLGIFGIDLTPVLAGLGITGVVLGFALQETISSLFSGVMIAVNNPFRVGDWIEIGQDGVAGTVVDMDLMCITLSTGDNKKYTVNNKYVWSNTILNYSYIDKRRLDMTVSVRYTDDIEKTKKVLRDLIASYPEILPEPAPLVEVGSYGDSAIIFYVRPWVAPSDYWNVYWRFNSDVLKTLRDNGIDMPFNQLVVQISKDS